MSAHPPDHKGCQTFHFAAFRWCVTHINELIAADPDAATFVPDAGISGLEQFLPLTPDPPDQIQLIRVDVNTTYAMTTDLDKPLLVAALDHKGDQLGAIVIDGWHRIYRALTEGRTHLPAYLLTRNTEQTARIPIDHWFLRGTRLTVVDSRPPDPAD